MLLRTQMKHLSEEQQEQITELEKKLREQLKDDPVVVTFAVGLIAPDLQAFHKKVKR